MKSLRERERERENYGVSYLTSYNQVGVCVIVASRARVDASVTERRGEKGGGTGRAMSFHLLMGHCDGTSSSVKRGDDSVSLSMCDALTGVSNSISITP